MGMPQTWSNGSLLRLLAANSVHCNNIFSILQLPLNYLQSPPWSSNRKIKLIGAQLHPNVYTISQFYFANCKTIIKSSYCNSINNIIIIMYQARRAIVALAIIVLPSLVDGHGYLKVSYILNI